MHLDIQYLRLLQVLNPTQISANTYACVGYLQYSCQDSSSCISTLNICSKPQIARKYLQAFLGKCIPNRGMYIRLK